MAPVIHEARTRGHKATVCLTGQHREMATQILSNFGIEADYNLDIMTENQTLSSLAARVLDTFDHVLVKESPDLVLVQGDTTSAFCGALGAFHRKIKVGHIEAGLRTHDKFSPFPEEMNRVLIGRVADYHFSPTELALRNLESEGISGNTFVTGNTSIDAIRMTWERLKNSNPPSLLNSFHGVDWNKKIILLTCHRRENFGQALLDICDAASELAQRYTDTEFILPVHPNPNVKSVVEEKLKTIESVHLLKPLEYEQMVVAMEKSYLILTDSGGLQEEGPFFKKPVLILRESTERQEGLEAGVTELVGTNKTAIVQRVSRLLDESRLRDDFTKKENPFGDGYAARKILEAIEHSLN